MSRPQAAFLVGEGISVEDSPTRSNTLQQYVNMHRVQLITTGGGVLPLQFHNQLYDVVSGRAKRMIVEKWYGHRDLEGFLLSHDLDLANIHWAEWGENIMWGQGEPVPAFEAFKASPTHLANIERASYTYQAAVFAYDPVGGDYTDTDTGKVKHLDPNWFIVHGFLTPKSF